MHYSFPDNSYLFKFSNRNTRKMCGICSKLTIKTPERYLVFVLLALNIFHTFSKVSIADFKQVSVS